MRQRYDILPGKILHCVEPCVSWRVVMVQPPIVGDGWADMNNAFSQSCEDFHVKNCINCLSRWYEPVVIDTMSIKKANEHGLLLGFAHSCFLGAWERRSVGVCHSEFCRLLSGSYLNNHVLSPVTTLSKKLGSSFTW